MSTTATTVNPSVQSTEVKPISVGKFNGSFKNFAANWFYLLKFYGMSAKSSHKLASDAMSALGNAMSKDSKLDATVSKANKDGQSSFKISGKSGLTQHSYAMSIIRTCQLLEKIREEKLTYKPLKLADMENFLQPDLLKYVSECENWAKSQKWEGEEAGTVVSDAFLENATEESDD